MRGYTARWVVPVAVLTAMSGAVVRGQPPSDGEQEVIVIRGQPMSVWPFADLQRRGYDVAEIPREENAFWTYLEAINTCKELPGELGDVFDYARSTAWPTGHDDRLTAFIKDPANTKALSLATKASAMASFQAYYFGDADQSVIAVLLPSLANYRWLVKLAVVDGRRLAASGEYDKAFDRYATAMRVGHHQESGITLIEGMVAIACWSAGHRAVCDLVTRYDVPEDQLRRMVKELGELASHQPSTRRGIEYERMLGPNVVDEIVMRPTELLRNFHAIGSVMCNGTWAARVNKLETPWDRFEARIGQLMLPDRTIKKHFDAYFSALLALADAPLYSKMWREFDEEALALSAPRWDLLARILLPSLARAMELSERCKAEARVTRTAAAIRLFTLENKGQPPADLDALQAWIPAEELIDPFSGDRLVYERQGRGWVLYSLGENMVDDGGKVGDRPWTLDYVVRYPAPAPEPFEPVATQGD